MRKSLWLSGILLCCLSGSACSWFGTDREKRVAGSSKSEAMTGAAVAIDSGERAPASVRWWDTGLHEVDETTELHLAPNGGELFVIRKLGTGSRSTEIHVLKTLQNLKPFGEFSLQTGTPLHETGPEWSFLVADNRDVFGIKRKGTGTGSTEIHVLDASKNYQRFSLQTGTALHEVDDHFEFLLAPNRDLFAIKKSQGGTESTEIHVLSAASNYQKFSLQTGTGLHETDQTYQFFLRSNRDLGVVKKGPTESHQTEVHVLSAASQYQDFVLHQATPLGQVGAEVSFSMGPRSGLLFAFKRSGGGSGKTQAYEVPVSYPKPTPRGGGEGGAGGGGSRDSDPNRPNRECTNSERQIRCGLLDYCCGTGRTYTCDVVGFGSAFKCGAAPTPKPSPTQPADCPSHQNFVKCQKESKCCAKGYGVCTGVGSFGADYVTCVLKPGQ